MNSTPYTGTFTYLGDNRSRGRKLHDTWKRGNLIMEGDAAASLMVTLDGSSDSQLARALTITARAAREDQAVSVQLRDALDDWLPSLLQRALAADGSDLLTAVTTAMIISRPTLGAIETAGRLPDILPVWLRPLAVTVTAMAVDGLRAQASDHPSVIPSLAGRLNNLANRLGDVGRREEALETAGEAVTIRRQLAEASPAAYLPDLAMSLSNLANRLSDVGRGRRHWRRPARPSPSAGSWPRPAPPPTSPTWPPR